MEMAGRIPLQERCAEVRQALQGRSDSRRRNSMKPYIVLATYRPKKWRASIVGRELSDLTAELGLQPHIDRYHGPLKLTGRNWSSELLHAEVRRRTFQTSQAESWHFDADLEPKGNPNCAIVLWASTSPTEIRWNEDCSNSSLHGPEIFRPKPFEVVIFNNMHCLHRRPKDVPYRRWVFRQRVNLGPTCDLKLP